jgi:hypothetical protein
VVLLRNHEASGMYEHYILQVSRHITSVLELGTIQCGRTLGCSCITQIGGTYDYITFRYADSVLLLSRYVTRVVSCYD